MIEAVTAILGLFSAGPLTKHQTSDVAFDGTIVAFTITPVTLPNRLGIDLPPVPAAVAQ